MSMMDSKVLERQIQGLSKEEAASLLSEALNYALDTDREFFHAQNWEAAFPVLVMLAQRDSARTEAFFERFAKKYKSSDVEWARRELKEHIALLQREEQLKALSPEELEAQVVFVSLLPGGKPDSGIEQEALIRALLVRQPERACLLAISWWEGKWQFDETVRLLFDACWKTAPENLLTFLTRWHGHTRGSLVGLWTERVIQEWEAASAPWLAQLLEAMMSFGSVERRSIALILEALPRWELAVRRPVLRAMMPVLTRQIPYLYRNQPDPVIQVLEPLWVLDSGPEWKWELQGLLYEMQPPERLKLARQLKRYARLRQFALAAHAQAIVVQQGKKLSDFLNRKYVRPDHRRRWRGFLALEAKIRAVPDEMLRAELLKKHAAVVKETSRARKGLVLAALNTDTNEPVLVRPGKQR